MHYNEVLIWVFNNKTTKAIPAYHHQLTEEPHSLNVIRGVRGADGYAKVYCNEDISTDPGRIKECISESVERCIPLVEYSSNPVASFSIHTRYVLGFICNVGGLYTPPWVGMAGDLVDKFYGDLFIPYKLRESWSGDRLEGWSSLHDALDHNQTLINLALA